VSEPIAPEVLDPLTDFVHTVDAGRTDSERRRGTAGNGEWTLCGLRIEYDTFTPPPAGTPRCPTCEQWDC
jgi:hypothetical protein